MKQKIHYVIILLVSLSCTSDDKKDYKADMVGRSSQKFTAGKKIDLFNITFKENLKDLGLDYNKENQSAQTLTGYGTFVSSSPDILIFNHQSLTGKVDENQNQVVLHYSLNKQVISAFEIQLYTSDALQKVDSILIHTLGQPGFTNTSSKHPGLAIDKNGNMMDGPRTEITYQLWTNKKTGISYHLLQYRRSEKLLFAELTAFNDRSNDADDWASFKNYDRYKKFTKDNNHE